MRILLLRHGQSEANKNDIIQGHMESPLSELGRQQAETAGKELSKSKIEFDAVYSSDLIRAEETVKIITGILGIKDIVFDIRLREFNLGDYEGKNSKKLSEKEDALLKSCWDDYTIRIPNGETVNEFIQRIKGIFDEIVEAAKDDSTILIVGHGGTLYHILQSILNILPNNQAWFVNCSVNEVFYSPKDEKWTLVKYNGEEI
ncbi:MAG: histidine phosphatase family protein [Candidatus Heimdallarchaeota archaeon]|nr:histidine phosphatase family protein [Candidatus Heimdallarchaeota archaeon]MBY8993922.1 histidine phosphatase family protein [Candidatus Heimdallarchaeota archaeon]